MDQALRVARAGFKTYATVTIRKPTMEAMTDTIATGMSRGLVAAVHGSVIDVRFPAGTLPAIEGAIAIEWDLGRPLIAVVQQHLNATMIRPSLWRTPVD